MKIKDNFLKQEDFDKLQELMMGPYFNWYFWDRYYHTSYHAPTIQNGVTKVFTGKPTGEPTKTELDKFQFLHPFYESNQPVSSQLEHLDCILQLIQPNAIVKIRANLLTRLPNIVENPFHTDLQDWPEEKQKQWKTSIFYVNTNNGYTILEDGTKVESVANRMLTFPTNMKHTGTSCTDKQTRIIINFNYYTL